MRPSSRFLSLFGSGFIDARMLTNVQAQPWLSSASWDCLLILSPAILVSCIVLIFRNQLTNNPSIPLWAWVCLILFVDVAHVYATLFRTYLDQEAFQKNKSLLLAIPATCLTAGCLLYAVNWLLFWRVLAYLAVFHFIRQQYGFVVLYSRKDPGVFEKFKQIDYLALYAATIYPLLYWHTHLPRNFNWLIDGDFISSMPLLVFKVGSAIYLIGASLYVTKEVILLKTTGYFNIPKNLLMFGTALSWWVGIISLNSDLAFTMTNVLSHGIPYMALIWLYRPKGDPNLLPAENGINLSTMFSVVKKLTISYAPAFLLFLVLLAYLEEGLWDGFVWREHLSLFAPFSHLPAISDPIILAILVPLLSLPQSTHYVLDGFIWRIKDRSSVWST
jgi:hypothetical protein